MLRRDASATTSSAGNFRSSRMLSISRPTLPVAPTTRLCNPSFTLLEIYRPGSETRSFPEPQTEIAQSAAALGPIAIAAAQEPLPSKFGPLSIVTFDTSKGVSRHCLGFVRAYDDPRLQLSGWFCIGGAEFVDRSTLACALDRLTLLAAGSEPKVGALFAQAELNRSFCGQRDPIIAATPKYHLLWQALANRPEPRRIGR
jgi:hypothetical protein